MNKTDKRTEVRKDVSIPATVRSKDGLFKTSCVIRQASTRGCQIATRHVDEVPDVISLEIQGLKSPREGQIVWREKNRAGVKFTI
jgi:hypothetical protein